MTTEQQTPWDDDEGPMTRPTERECCEKCHTKLNGTACLVLFPIDYYREEVREVCGTCWEKAI